MDRLQTSVAVTRFPGRYIQGPHACGVIPRLAEELQVHKPAVICDAFVAANILPNHLAPVLTSLQPLYLTFGGEVTHEEVARLVAAGKHEKCDMIIGIGGGKTVDVSRAVAFESGRLPVIAISTLASTDAPCSARVVFYTPDGRFESYRDLPSNPTAVIMDTEILIKAPVRFLVAGIGDALSTWFEAESCAKVHAPNCTGFRSGMSAVHLARCCYDSLFEYGEEAVLSAKRGVITPAFEHIVETNTLLSGIGFESCGLAAAHAIHNGLSEFHCTHSFQHGEKVNIGTLASLFLTNKPKAEIDKVYRFCKAVGLPITLAQLGFADPLPPDTIRMIGQHTCVTGSTIYNEDPAISPAAVSAAVAMADEYGKKILAEH
ncbi:putative Glycerol dehydrogenase [Paratrimastix pyriformis]|uniref:Glycerol dehydrogenase n=1 Tax=Paratrimastix pyriformis TaxID=342808 RepID=A0ABQ8UFL2_9EUKA|nr:putative Glycerol dehydrogenase [Paratrimastix pyriformis]